MAEDEKIYLGSKDQITEIGDTDTFIIATNDGIRRMTKAQVMEKLGINQLTKKLENDFSQLSEEIDDLDGLTYGIYVGDTQPTNGVMYWLDTSEDTPVEPDEPIIPDEPDVPEVTLSSISATYNGGEVTVGTALTDLTGITVKATYSDGSTKNVTGYTLSGTIAEGENTITVSYGGKTATFKVTGVVESGGDTPSENPLTVEQVKELIVGQHSSANSEKPVLGYNNESIIDMLTNGFIMVAKCTGEYANVTLRITDTAYPGNGNIYVSQNVDGVISNTKETILGYTLFPDGNYYKAVKHNVEILDGSTPEEKASLYNCLWIAGTQYSYAWILKMNDYDINHVVELLQEASE